MFEIPVLRCCGRCTALRHHDSLHSTVFRLCNDVSMLSSSTKVIATVFETQGLVQSESGPEPFPQIGIRHSRLEQHVRTLRSDKKNMARGVVISHDCGMCNRSMTVADTK